MRNQFVKDFSLSGLQLEIENCRNYNELKNQVRDSLEKLVLENPSALKRLLYMIDVNEKKLTIKLQNQEGELEVLLDELLKRVALKVLFRLQYAGLL